MPLKLFHASRGQTPSPFDAVQRPHPASLILLVALWTASLGNVALWQSLAVLPELSNLRGLVFCAGFGLMIFAVSVTLLSLVGWGRLLQPVLTLWLVAAALGTYFMLSYHIVIDASMMINVLQTDPREAADLFNVRLLFCLFLLAVLPAVPLWRAQPRPLGVWKALWHQLLLLVASVALLAVTLMASFQDFSSLMRNHTQLRLLINPLNSVYALGELAARPFQIDETALLPVGRDARPGPVFQPGTATPLLVLVVGETARSGNFSLNGYERPTNALLAQESLGSWRNVWSCGTSTATSLPCMFSHLGRQGYEGRSARHENLLDVLQHAGLAVLWIDNQSGCKGLCDRIPQDNTSHQSIPGLCSDGECLDEVMLKGLDARIAALPADRRARGVVIVLHQMGSHGPAYSKRSPAALKKFQPECTSNALQDCSQQAVVNAYDNSIAYTDHFLSRTLQWLKTRPEGEAPAMVYLADHGESLGENNLYLHGLPYSIAPDVQKRVPWITWLSPAFARQTGLSTACLQGLRDAKLSHDHYFHSVLGLLDIHTSVYQPGLDAYAACRPSSK